MAEIGLLTELFKMSKIVPNILEISFFFLIWVRKDEKILTFLHDD